MIQILFSKEDERNQYGFFAFTAANKRRMKEVTFLDSDLNAEQLEQLHLSAILVGQYTDADQVVYYPSLLVTPSPHDSELYLRVGMLLLDGGGLAEYAPKFGGEFPAITLV